MTSLFMCVVIIPFSFFFYDTDEDQDYVSENWLADLELELMQILILFWIFIYRNHDSA